MRRAVFIGMIAASAANAQRIRVVPLPAAEDVVDRRGVLLGQVTMPENETIVGFGAKAAYVATKDDNDIVRIERHPWPTDRPLLP